MDAALAFATLFLGLTSGPQSVEVAVTGSVAAIELRLDGTTQARLAGAPWRTTVDLGGALEPHRLSAVAFDAAGREIDSVSQLINVPRPAAEISLLVERDAAGRPIRVRWVGGAVLGDYERPQVEMTLDRRRLVVDASGSAELPALDLDQPHVVSAVVRFGKTVSARQDLVLGGAVNDQIRGDLSSTIYHPADRKRPVDISLLAARVGSRPARVTAAERGRSTVIVVRPTSFPSAVLRRLAGSRPPSRASLANPLMRPEIADLAALRLEARLEDGDALRVLWPLPTGARGVAARSRLFDATPDFPAEKGGFYWLLGSIVASSLRGSPRWAEAVAVGGSQAHASGHRRAVVLVLDGSAADPSQYSAEQARRYLKRLRVPLFVWSLTEGEPPLSRPWGGSVNVLDRRGLERAVRDLRAELDAQRVVWIEGTEVPDEIEIFERVAGD